MAISAAVIMLTTSLGACEVKPATEAGRQREESRAAVTALLDGGLELDLGERVTRADVGLIDGELSTVLTSKEGGGEPFQVTVHFPDGRVLRTDASDVTVMATGPDGPPMWLSITRRRMSDNDLRAAITDAARRFNIEQIRRDSFYQEWKQAGHLDRATSAFPTDVMAPVQLHVEPVGERPGEANSIHYSVQLPATRR